MVFAKPTNMQLIFVPLLIAIACDRVNSVFPVENNACRTLKDYHSMQNNNNCWYDFIADLEMPELLKNSGRAFEVHKAITPDGHILTMFRLSNKELPNRKRSPVLLQHGMVSSAKHWVSLGNDSLAFQLHNHGFDVWMGNYRGSKYSDEHTKYTVNDEEYWEHTIDDLALVDLPVMINKVLEVTKVQEIVYAGHSLGGSMALMYASEFPQEAKRHIKAAILVAPAYKLSNIISPIRLFDPFAELIWHTVKKYRLMKLTSYGPISNNLMRLVCFQNADTLSTCMKALGLLYGPKTAVKPEQFPNILKQQLTGTSIKVAYHLVFLLRGAFSKFNFGAENTKIYGQPEPPPYNVSKIEMPTLVMYAKNDWLTTKKDVLELYADMNKEHPMSFMEVPEENFNHVDFLFGSTARKHFVEPFVTYVKSID